MKGLVSEAGDFLFDTQCLDGSKQGKNMDYTGEVLQKAISW